MRHLDERYAADPRAVTRARGDLAAFAVASGASAAQVDDVRLAVSEAVTNAVLHGYRGAPGEVRVSARSEADELSIVVRDGGTGISAGVSCVPAGLGCGLGLVAEVTDAMTVQPLPRGGTELWMRFGLAPRALAA